MQRRPLRLFLPFGAAALAVVAGCGSESNNADEPAGYHACGILVPEGACVDDTCTYIKTNCADDSTLITIAEFQGGAAPGAGGAGNVPQPPGVFPPAGGGTGVGGAANPPGVPQGGTGPAQPPAGGTGSDVTPPMGGAGNPPPAAGGMGGETTPPPPPPPPGPTVTPDNRSCPGPANMIADFEEGSAELFRSEDRAGLFEGYGDDAGQMTVQVVDEGADECNKGVLHVSGSGYASYVGVSAVFQGVWDEVEGEYTSPTPYDAVSRGYTGISFRAKQGTNQATPVRISLGTPWTEGDDSGDGSCTDDPDATHPCWNRPGHFLMDREQLTADWKTFTLCFDSDLYPMWLPFGPTVEMRRAIGSNLLNFQIQFNQAVDPASYDSAMLTEYSRSEPFDFYIDDVQFVSGECASGEVFQSAPETTTPFGQNGNIGSCSVATDAAKFNAAISEAYVRWRDLFVQADGRVFDPQSGNYVSEAIGYGMMLSAAMGDKEAFDRIWGWAASAIGNPPTSLLGWNNGQGGSATDGDTDMAYGLLMAEHQWPGNGYGTAGQALAQRARQEDFAGGSNIPRGGNGWHDVFNPSYFSPAFYRAFSGWDNVITDTYSHLATCQDNFGGLVPDWCTPDSGMPVGSGGAQVSAPEVCTGSAACLAFEAARVPLRLGHDACLGGPTAVIAKHIGMLKGQADPDVEDGARIDLLRAGWANGAPTTGAVANAMAFIGPVGVGAMGLGDTATLDAAFRATLDIMERPEFYNTYYQNTVGLMSLLLMSGNWPEL